MTSYFSNIERCEKSIHRGTTGTYELSLLIEACNFFFSQNGLFAPRLVKKYVTTQVCFLHTVYGHSIFSPVGKILLANHLSEEAGLKEDIARKCLDFVGTSLCEKAILQQGFVHEIQEHFISTLLRRILSAEAGEESDFGVSFASASMREKIREAFSQMLGDNSQSSIEILKDMKAGLEVFNLLQLHVGEVKKNPLHLIAWRIEALCFHKVTGSLITHRPDKDSILKLALVMSLLMPMAIEEGKPALGNSPFTSKHIFKFLCESGQWDKKLVFDWLEVEENDFINLFELIAAQAVSHELFFSVPARKERAYGLSRRGMLALQPYEKIIAEAILKKAPATQINPIEFTSCSNNPTHLL